MLGIYLAVGNQYSISNASIGLIKEEFVSPKPRVISPYAVASITSVAAVINQHRIDDCPPYREGYGQSHRKRHFAL